MMGWALFHITRIKKKEEEDEEKKSKVEGVPLGFLALALLMMSLNLLQFFRNRALR